MAKKKQGDDTAIVVCGLIIMGLIWFVVTFWYVFATIGAVALLIVIVAKLVNAHDAKQARLQVAREALLALCAEQNRAYNADPIAYLAQLERAYRDVDNEAAGV